MKKAMLFLIASIISVGASAASFDFVALSIGNEHGGQPISFTDGSVTVEASAVNAQTNAYLDEGAGLGVCSNLTGGGQCNPSNDDNIDATEALMLDFITGPTTLLSFSLLNGNHQNDFTGGTFDFFVDNVLQVLVSGPLASTFNGHWTGTEFKFVNTSSDANDIRQQFYVSSISTVPVPAALFLFAPALLGFFGLRRKATLAA